MLTHVLLQQCNAMQCSVSHCAFVTERKGENCILCLLYSVLMGNFAKRDGGVISQRPLILNLKTNDSSQICFLILFCCRRGVSIIVDQVVLLNVLERNAFSKQNKTPQLNFNGTLMLSAGQSSTQTH